MSTITKTKALSNLTYLAHEICKKHGWKKCILEELIGRPGVLGININKGQCIQIKIVDDGSTTFIEWYHLVGTLAHELAHNLIDDHSPAFYREMDKIHDELEKLDKYEEIFAEMSKTDYNKGYTVITRPNTIKSTTWSIQSNIAEPREKRRAKMLQSRVIETREERRSKMLQSRVTETREERRAKMLQNRV